MLVPRDIMLKIGRQNIDFFFTSTYKDITISRFANSLLNHDGQLQIMP